MRVNAALVQPPVNERLRREVDKRPSEADCGGVDERVNRKPPVARPSEQRQRNNRHGKKRDPNDAEDRLSYIQVGMEEPAVRVVVEPLRPAAKPEPKVHGQAVKMHQPSERYGGGRESALPRHQTLRSYGVCVRVFSGHGLMSRVPVSDATITRTVHFSLRQREK